MNFIFTRLRETILFTYDFLLYELHHRYFFLSIWKTIGKLITQFEIILTEKIIW